MLPCAAPVQAVPAYLQSQGNSMSPKATYWAAVLLESAFVSLLHLDTVWNNQSLMRQHFT